MLTYIKLGPIGDAFLDDSLGIYLNKDNAVEVDDSLLKSRLVNFIKTGFLVEIKKIEYDNLKIKFQNARNIPLNVVNLSKSNVLNPVEDIVVNPPISQRFGERYLVGLNGGGQFQGRGDYIAEWTTTGWVFIKPEDGMILPVYSLGISVHYKGTYPSGYWDISGEKITELEIVTPGPITNQEYALQLFLTEQEARILADLGLAKSIQDLLGAIGNIKATALNTTITDIDNNFLSSNVEGALIELYQSITNGNTTISNLVTQINQVVEQVSNIQLPSFSTLFYGNYVPADEWEIIEDPITGEPLTLNPYRDNTVVIQDHNLYISLVESPTLIPIEDTEELEWRLVGKVNTPEPSNTGFVLTYQIPGEEVVDGNIILLDRTGMPEPGTLAQSLMVYHGDDQLLCNYSPISQVINGPFTGEEDIIKIMISFVDVQPELPEDGFPLTLPFTLI